MDPIGIFCILFTMWWFNKLYSRLSVPLYDCFIKHLFLNCSDDLDDEQLDTLDEQPAPTIKYEDKYRKEVQNMVSQDVSDPFFIKQRLKELVDCYVMEYTPHGNVIMVYDGLRETFKYFSDNVNN